MTRLNITHDEGLICREAATNGLREFERRGGHDNLWVDINDEANGAAESWSDADG